MIDMKSMSRKEKVEYIWDYYKIHIIIGAVILIIIGSTIYSQLTKIEQVFNLTYIGTSVDENKRIDFEKKLTHFIVKDDKKKQAFIGNIPLDILADGNKTFQPQYIQKLMAQVAVGEIDIMLIDKNVDKSFFNSDMFLRLDNIKGVDLEKLKYDISDAGVYIINVEDSKILQEEGINTKDMVAGIVASSKRKDKAVQALMWIAEKN
jgi:hypothetical protein